MVLQIFQDGLGARCVVLREVELRERQLRERSIAGAGVIGQVLILLARIGHFAGIRVHRRKGELGRISLFRTAVLVNDLLVRLGHGFLLRGLGGEAGSPIRGRLPDRSGLQCDRVGKHLLPNLVLGVPIINGAAHDDHKGQHDNAAANDQLAIFAEEIERFFDFERNVILLQFFAREMSRHENLWMGLKLYINTFNKLALAGSLKSGRIQGAEIRAQRRGEMFKTKKPAAVADSDQERFSSGDVARIAGVSLRQLQWWDERNVVSPRQEGHRRVYLQQEVVEVSVIAELRRKGFSLQKIRRVLRFLQKEMGKRLGDAFAGESEIHLITDGKNIFLEEEPGRIIDVLKNAKQPMFLVCVTDQLNRFKAASGRKPARSEVGASGSARSRLG